MEEIITLTYNEKHEGTRHFRLENFEEASKCYSKALIAMGYLFKQPELTNELAHKLVKEIQIPCLLNLSACMLRQGIDYADVIEHCSGVISIDHFNAKAYYRRAQAQFHLGNLREAQADIGQALKLDPNNSQLVEFNSKVRTAILQ